MPQEYLGMFQKIRWTIHGSVKTKEKAHRVFGWVQDKLGVPLSITDEGWNPEDDSLYRIDADSELNAADIQEAVFQVLTTADRLGGTWSVLGPQRDPPTGGKWEFHGWCQGHFTISGVHSAYFAVHEDD